MDAVERELGERLRLAEYAEYFGSEDRAQALADRLSEGDPCFVVSALLLRQWYARCHPGSGPLRYDTAADLEGGLGPELRQQYPGMKERRLHSVLGQRIKAVLVSEWTARTWVAQFGAPAPRMPARPLAARCLRRPAAAAKGAPAVKRSRVSASASAAAGAPVSATVLADAAALERECGPRYRREHSDLGLGHSWRELQAVLADWGYSAGPTLCRKWLRQYRLGDGAKDCGASVYVLAREDLMRWYHVQGLSGLELTDKYRSVHGVYAHPTPLTKWLKAPAQALVCLDNNEDHYWGISFSVCVVRGHGFIFQVSGMFSFCLGVSLSYLVSIWFVSLSYCVGLWCVRTSSSMNVGSMPWISCNRGAPRRRWGICCSRGIW